MTDACKDDRLKAAKRPEWSKKEAKKPFNYWELSQDKTKFPVKWSPKGFEGSAKLEQHVSSHMDSVGAKGAAEYVQKAQEFLTAPRGTHGAAFVSKSGDVYRYDYDTHEFAVASPKGVIRTYWRLSDSGDAYWEVQIKKYGN